MVVRSLNPWAKVGGIEPQRADLWVLNLEKVLSVVRSTPQFSLLDLPDPDTTRYYARQISFPDTRIAEYEAKSHSIPRLYPGYDEVIGSVRVEFLVDAFQSVSGGRLPVQAQVQSRIYNLIECWHQLSRVGRPMRSSTQSGLELPLDENPKSYASSFKFDALVQLYAGLLEDLTNSNSAPGDVTEGVEPTTTFNLRRGWVGSYQLGNVDQATNGFLILTANLNVEAITPYSGVTSGKTVLG